MNDLPDGLGCYPELNHDELLKDFFLEYAHYFNLTIFLVVFLILAICEITIPKRPLRVKKSQRWFNNISLTFLNTLILRFLLPGSLLTWTLFAQEQHWGIFNYLDWPNYLEIILVFVILDFAIYLQHVVFHFVPVLWKLHQVHHADMDLDVTSGTRFHTLEMVLSMFIKYALVVLLGPPLLAVLLFEVVLNAAAMFNHSNIRLPLGLDSFLRWILVTPDMHRIHHSVKINEANTNFGFNLPWWDRLFGTYTSQPELGQEKMVLGLSYVTNENEATSILSMLKMPFHKFKK